MSFAQNRLDFRDPPKLFLKQDQENAKDVFGKTAYYDPNEKSITIFTTGRHPKDILRSIAHELVHHCQNLRGDLSPEKCGPMGTDYAQKDDHMREMEREAYEKGNMCFRDWDDGIKVAIQKENKSLKENKKMVKISKKDLKKIIGKIVERKFTEQKFGPGTEGVDSVRWKGQDWPDLKGMGSFKAAFDKAREYGLEYFGYKGKPYHTRKTKPKLAAPSKDMDRLPAKDQEMIQKMSDKTNRVTSLDDDLPKLDSLYGHVDDFMSRLDDKMPKTGEVEPVSPFGDSPEYAMRGVTTPKIASMGNIGDPTDDEDKIVGKPSGKLPENVENNEDIEEGHCSKRDDKKKMEENDEIDIEEINRQPHPNAKGPDKKDCAKCKGEGCKHCKGKGTHKMEEAALENPKKADLNKDGKLSPYEKKRGAAIEKSMKDQNESKIQTPEQEQKLYESRFNKRNEEIFDKLKKLWTK